MFAAVIFSNNTWTFWDVMLFFFIWIPLVTLWFMCLFDIFARRDLSGGAKVLWVVAVIVFPWIGALAYLLLRSRSADAYSPSYPADGRASGQSPSPGGTGDQVPVS
jgi:hypothetical protein